MIAAPVKLFATALPQIRRSGRPDRVTGIGRLLAKMGITSVVLCVAISMTSHSIARVEPTAAGLWEKVDSSGDPEAWFRIAECDGVYKGTIVKIFPTRGEEPLRWRCTECEGRQKNAPVLGITFIDGMRRKGLIYENGTILDPRDGSVYSALMELSPDGEQLVVRGYLGIALLGQSQVWKRLPDEAFEPRQPDPCDDKMHSRRQ